jgi:7-carboxy-7-deazaguanine synthase
MSRPLLVNEIFGPTFQGEGRQTGQRCFFLRTSTCNLECKWCDTPQTWVYSERKVEKHSKIKAPFDIKAESHSMTIPDVYDELCHVGLDNEDLLVISGGEPMLQQESLQDLLAYISARKIGVRFAVETAGTILPNEFFGFVGLAFQWNVSIKLGGSNNPVSKRNIPDVIAAFRRMGADFKFVVTDQYDMSEVDLLIEEFAIPDNNVWIMPEGTDGDEVIIRAKRLESWILERGYNLTLRQHVLLHGDQRGF